LCASVTSSDASPGPRLVVSDEKIRLVRAEFLSKRRVSCAKCLHISRQMRLVLSSICNLEKLAHFGLVEIENGARNGSRD
jgi:hypothetical protein